MISIEVISSLNFTIYGAKTQDQRCFQYIQARFPVFFITLTKPKVNILDLWNKDRFYIFYFKIDFEDIVNKVLKE